MPFWLSISVLGLVQAALVALPAPRRVAWLDRLRSPWLALIPALSIVVVVGAIELDSGSATALAWLALVTVPPLAAMALAYLLHGSRPFWAWGTLPLFALAWVAKSSLVGEAAATALSGLGCITLGWLLVSTAPARWLRLGVYAMAAIDAIYVSADLLQGPSAVLSVAVPTADLPQLQAVHFGHAQMGFGDLFVAALVGCLLAGDVRRQRMGAGLVAVLALIFDLLFFAVDELPATVPVALALALATWLGERERARTAQL